MIIKKLQQLWCDHFHAGGSVKRDSYGRINWQCDLCGRWSDYPISLEEEEKTYNEAMKYYENQRDRIE